MLLLKIHLSCVALSFSLFCLRGFWVMQESPMLGRRLWMRLIPDSVDTALLTTGVLMMFITGQFPDEHPWLAAKLIALLLYVSLGFVALRFGKSRRTRFIAFISACLTFVYIVGAATQHDPASWFVFL